MKSIGGYARPDSVSMTASAAGTVFTPHFRILQLRVEGKYQQLDLVSTLIVTGRWREAILSHSNGFAEPVRRRLSGHDGDGGPRTTRIWDFQPSPKAKDNAQYQRETATMFAEACTRIEQVGRALSTAHQ